ncbi:hypothetical protein GLOTRDRAFT_57100 [Gloeophyllum trabeum ATCC 11539]|uniref:Nucleoporin Nup133/Nup155-like C-terminal domain-containing protein n=1 Tax=Gloeophyllum trabeum (strain ATCC 11539 / FP-39264 / Madison 617) TaxID=670483 RepID=S7QEM5_GLOTA|nr:uncharacterized protein GLOTRDRAFT_57100 [Gloeophyllum trabeum ATCC 11539]EPQ58276.1 hypothetical protein GLOTRDRAFT_57100 [Gloeophyllum trabeum ATCC 11539]
MSPDRLSSVADDVSMTSDTDRSRISVDSMLRAEGVFARSNELTAIFYANLPVEVKQVLKNADFYRDAYSGDVDASTGFAVVATALTCFVWQHAQALTGTPTCYIFSCPPDLALGTTPLHVLVPFGSGREPGLILIASSGEIRFWDSIAIGLAGGEHYVSIQLKLASGETVTTLTRSDAVTYVASTSSGRLLRLTVTSSGSKYHISHHTFSRPESAPGFSQYFSSLWTPPTVPQAEGGYVSSVALGKGDETGRDVWALVDTRIQKWNMTAEDWEELVFDEDAMGKIRTAIRRTSWSNIPPRDIDLDLELLDLAVEKSGKLVILCSYAGTEYDLERSTFPRRVYFVAHVTLVGETLTVEKVAIVPYQTTSSSGAPMHARMKLLASGELMAVQFGDAVALCARDTAYRDRIALKSATDRTLGLGAVEHASELLIMTATTIMKVMVDMEQVNEFDAETGEANIIKSIMTQAVLYGSNPENPLSFSFPPDVDEGSLMSGAIQLSESILGSDPTLVRPNVDMQAQLSGREELLGFLIQFINDNAVLPKVSQACRQQLMSNAQKQHAALELWTMLNKFQSAGLHHSVLAEGIRNYFYDLNEEHHDPDRAFFRSKVADLGRLMVYVMDVTRRSSYEMNRNLLGALTEANRVVYMVLDSAMAYRRQHGATYGVQEPMYNPWTSAPPMIDILFELFNMTAKIVEAPTAEVGSAAGYTRQELRKQIPDIGFLLFACMTERTQWLQSPVAADQPGNDKERMDLEERFTQSRPTILDTIRRIGYPDKAFALAEHYHDLRSLASLCHKEKVYPPEENPYADKIRACLDRFREAFAIELFQWYVENGELRTLFAQQEEYGDYIDLYFSHRPNPAISWIKDMGKSRYGAASQALLSVAKKESTLEVRHLMLSIGKLSQLARLHEPEASIDEDVLSAFHDGLDFISVHENLRDKFKAILSTHHGKMSLDAQVDMIARVTAKSLAGRKPILRVFKDLVRQLLQGKALSVEDIVDLLTLKDNTAHEIYDYSTALQILSEAKDLPEVRVQNAMRAVWRRIYSHDDWDALKQTSGLSDDEVTDRLKDTALYITLCAVYGNGGTAVLYPTSCAKPPSKEVIAARFPGMDPDGVDALVEEYRQEGDAIISAGIEENGMWERVMHLVQARQSEKADVSGNTEGDVFMED